MRLIDADALMDDIKETIENSGCVNHEGEILDCIEYAPTIDTADDERLKNALKEIVKLACESVEREKVLAKLEAEVTAIIEPKRGEWVEAKVGVMSLYPDGQKMCSVCKEIMPSAWKVMPNYCYNCGARMEDKP